MNCLKCGAEIKAPAVFCESCLKEMERNPVDRESKVVLPARPVSASEIKVPRAKPQPKAEEIIVHQRGLIRRLRITACCLLVLSLVLGALLYFFGRFDELPVHALGQNFKTAGEETSDPSAPTAAPGTEPGTLPAKG